MNVLYTHMADHGRSWFVGAILIMSVATYTLAVYIGNVLNFLRWSPRRLGGGGKNARPEGPPNVWRFLQHGGKAIFDSPSHVDKGNTDFSQLSTDDEKSEGKDQSSQVLQVGSWQKQNRQDSEANTPRIWLRWIRRQGGLIHGSWKAQGAQKAQGPEP
jgi:hypothetical protein